MKKSLPVLLILAGMLSFCGCSKQVYTHQQVMQGFHTKADVLKQFGMPDQKTTSEGIEEWTYNKDIPPNKAAQPVADTARKSDTTKSYVATARDSLKLLKYTQNKKYIRFLFDSAGNVSGYKSNGVNLAYTKKDNFGMGLLKVLGITVAVVVIIGVEIANNSDVVDF
ncbi:MAG TPA: hypothetical protein VK668_13310 [Mucilaginibacter sp.]|nr:hypothetical protein [Mucilaginibacter sp.]